MEKLSLKFLLIFLAVVSQLKAQDGDVVFLSNPSFEDFNRASKEPRGWYDCGMYGESPPDVQPGHFRVKQRPNSGNTYLGMVTRDNETWESVSQRLSQPIKGGSCYQFSIFLSHSEGYFSISRTTNEEAYFIKPVVLRIWGGNNYCDKRELLGQSDIVDNSTWEEFQFMFKPKRNYSFILFEAFYKTPTLFPYNGNVLVDNSSNIVEVFNCEEYDDEVVMRGDEEDYENQFEEEDPVVNVAPKPNPPTPEPPTPPTDNTPPPNVPSDPPTTAGPKIMKELDDVVEVGQIIEIPDLNFDKDSFTIVQDMYPVLDEIYQYMMKYKKVEIEIGGHTNTIPPHDYCYWLSRQRAYAVADYLFKKGIDYDRISFRGYGKSNPLDDSKTESAHRKNQRVEIKILSLNG